MSLKLPLQENRHLQSILTESLIYSVMNTRLHLHSEIKMDFAEGILAHAAPY